MIRILVILLKFHKNFDFKDFDQNSSVFQSENLMTMEFLWNSRKLQEKFNQYSDQKIRWPRNSYEILENYRKSLDIPKIPTSAYSSITFSSLFPILLYNLCTIIQIMYHANWNSWYFSNSSFLLSFQFNDSVATSGSSYLFDLTFQRIITQSQLITRTSFSCMLLRSFE